MYLFPNRIKNIDSFILFECIQPTVILPAAISPVHSFRGHWKMIEILFKSGVNKIVLFYTLISMVSDFVNVRSKIAHVVKGFRDLGDSLDVSLGANLLAIDDPVN